MTLNQLLAELENPDPEARERAIRRLRIADGPQAVSAIMGAFNDPSEDVRTRAALALGEMVAREVVPELIERLRSDPSDDARAICAFALTKFSDTRALQPFLDALHDQASG